jgi:hypothetical protein
MTNKYINVQHHVASQNYIEIPSHPSQNGYHQENKHAGHRWLTPVIIATPEAEVKRTAVESQPRKIVHETLSRKTLSQKIGLEEWLKA